MKFKLEGNIYNKQNQIVGSYAYSFKSCHYSFEINNAAHHFWHKDELAEFLTMHGYHI